MGEVTMGPAREITLELARLAGINVFVETGTFRGYTTKWASGVFEKVYTIEKSQELQLAFVEKLVAPHNITSLCGDSREKLPQVIREIGDSPALFWLDGHWSGGATSGIDDECPLIDELEIIANRSRDIIMIDDARMFLSAPPAPHDASQWPTIFDIAAVFKERFEELYVQIFRDVIFITPNSFDFVQVLKKNSLPPE